MHKQSSSETLPLSLKRHQLFTKPDFTQLFNGASKKHGRFFILLYLQDQSLKNSSFGSVVSKKNAKTSVHRNLIKRLVREHFRLSQHELDHLKIMLITKKEVATASKEDLNQDLSQLFTTLKKLQKATEQAKL